MKVFSKKLWLITTIVFGVLAVIMAVGLAVGTYFEQVINLALNVKTQEIIPDPDATIYFWTDYENEDDLVAYEKELCRDIEGEGAALLLNKDDTLPARGGHQVQLLLAVLRQPALRRHRLGPGLRQRRGHAHGGAPGELRRRHGQSRAVEVLRDERLQA